MVIFGQSAKSYLNFGPEKRKVNFASSISFETKFSFETISLETILLKIQSEYHGLTDLENASSYELCDLEGGGVLQIPGEVLDEDFSEQGGEVNCSRPRAFFLPRQDTLKQQACKLISRQKYRKKAFSAKLKKIRYTL